MDFVKKFAQEQLEKQLGGDQNQQQQHQGQGQGDQQSGYGGGSSDAQSGLGGLLNSFTGGGQQQQQQQQNYQSGQQGYQQGYQQENQQGYQGQSQGNQSGGFGVTGGPQYNAPHGSGGASSYGGGGVPSINQNEALQAASQHGVNANENASLFSQAFSFVQGMNKDDKDIDEDDVQRKHQEAYGQGQAGQMSANAIGSAAALQAIKQFTSGSSGATQQKGGNDMVSKIIGMAVAEAVKLFDKSGGAASGTKEDAVTSAGQTVMKLLLKNQVSGMIGGGQSGGLSQLMGMASKFM